MSIMERFNPFQINYRKMWIELFNSKKKLNLLELNKTCNMNYPHLTQVIDCYVREGYIKREREGHSYLIELTDDGKEFAKSFLNCLNEIDLIYTKSKEIKENGTAKSN